MEWYEIEKLFTKKDREAIERAHRSGWEDIDEDWAETVYGWNEVHSIKMAKYHREED